jgi:hypothetical protein
MGPAASRQPAARLLVGGSSDDCGGVTGGPVHTT